jgi:hypothetical protein
VTPNRRTTNTTGAPTEANGRLVPHDAEAAIGPVVPTEYQQIASPHTPGLSDYDAPLNGAGYVECDAGAASEAYRRYTETKRDRLRRELEGGPPAERYIGNEILDLLEDDIPWRAFHQSCDPDPHAGTYWVDVESIRTWQDVLKWTLHLNEKAWVQHTNWDAILRRLIAKGEIAP